MEKRNIIRLKSLISYAGEIVDIKEYQGRVESYLIKPSRTSNVLISIPSDEIKNIFFADGSVISEEDVYVRREI